MRTRLLLLAAGVSFVFFLFIADDLYPTCLGPLGVTLVQCVAGYDRTADPDWSPGLGPRSLVFGGLVCLFVLAAALSSGLMTRRLGRPLTVAGLAGALLGGLLYEATRMRVLSGPTSTGDFISVAVPTNPTALALTAIVCATLATMASAVVFRIQASRRRPAGE